MQQTSPLCLITPRLILEENEDIDVFKSLIDCIKKSKLEKNDYLNILGYYISIQVESTRYLQFVKYIIQTNTYNYKYNLKDILLNGYITDYINQQRDFMLKTELLLDIITVLKKSDCKFTVSDIKWLLSEFITITDSPRVAVRVYTILIPVALYISTVIKILQLVKMDYLFNEIVLKRKQFLGNLNLTKMNSNKLPGSWD